MYMVYIYVQLTSLTIYSKISKWQTTLYSTGNGSQWRKEMHTWHTKYWIKWSSET